MIPYLADTSNSHYDWKKAETKQSLKFETFGAGIIFFLNFSTPVYKMWIIQEPNKLELWNKLHFEEGEKNGEYIPCLKYSVLIFVE